MCRCSHQVEVLYFFYAVFGYEKCPFSLLLPFPLIGYVVYTGVIYTKENTKEFFLIKSIFCLATCVDIVLDWSEGGLELASSEHNESFCSYRTSRTQAPAPPSTAAACQHTPIAALVHLHLSPQRSVPPVLSLTCLSMSP